MEILAAAPDDSDVIIINAEKVLAFLRQKLH